MEEGRTLQETLFSMQDIKYGDFHSKLIPNIPRERVIGVQTPKLRKLAKEYAKTDEAREFMQQLPHKYYEEDNLHGFLIESIKDYDACIAALNAFLPYVDNWATCDCTSPKVLKKHPQELLQQVKIWIAAQPVYMVRFGIKMLMAHYLDEEFKTEYLELAAQIPTRGEYYIMMMIAWYFATALAKQYDATLPFIEQQRLEREIHNKAIQKAIESRRIMPEQKEYLRSLKRKAE